MTIRTFKMTVVFEMDSVDPITSSQPLLATLVQKTLANDTEQFGDYNEAFGINGEDVAVKVTRIEETNEESENVVDRS